TNIFAFLKENRLANHIQKRKSKSTIVKKNTFYSVSAKTLLGNKFLPFSAKIQLLPGFLKILSYWNSLDMHKLWQGEPYDKKTVKESFTGKSGKELVDYLLQPMLDGYCYWSADKTSEVTLLLFLKFLVGGRYFYPLGLQSIPEKLAKGCNVLLSQEVTSVQNTSDNKYKIITDKKTLLADGVVCATTATNVLKIVKNLTAK